MYTDASFDNRTQVNAYGCVLFEDERIVRAVSGSGRYIVSNITEAEALAAKTGLRMAKKIVGVDAEMLIHTDNEAVLTAMLGGSSSNKKLRQLTAEVKLFPSLRCIKVCREDNAVADALTASALRAGNRNL